MSAKEVERLTTVGGTVAALLALALALSPLILVFAPILPLAVLIFIMVRREKLGTAWMVLYVLAWVVLILCFWPFLGLSLT